MNYKDLIISAGNIPAARQNTISEYQNNMELLTAAINTYMKNREDVLELVGKNNISMMENNHSNHVLFINSILKNPNPEVLVDTIHWVFRTYRSHGFSANYWNIQIGAWPDILKNQLSHQAFQEICPLYKWIQKHIPAFEKMSSERREKINEP